MTTPDLPYRLEPMLGVPASEPFDSPERIFEVKFDGLRALAFISNREVRLQSRNFQDISQPFSAIAEALLDTVQADGVILDGQLVSTDKNGVSRLPLVVQRFSGQDSSSESIPVNFEVFDILYKDHQPLLAEPLMLRKRVLNQTVSSAGPIHLCRFVEGEGINFFNTANELGLGGMIAKHKNSHYLAGRRSRHWLKIKATKTANLIVGGYTIGEGKKKELFGSVMLGAYDKKRLRFVGSVGGGFTKADTTLIHSLLSSKQADLCPFANPPDMQKLLYWCDPELVVQVKYAEYTDSGALRFPIFVSIRPDINPRECSIQLLKGT